MTPIELRNQQILQLRREGVSQRELARKFKLSPSRIYLLERRFKADRLMAERCAGLREEMRVADDPDRMWLVIDMVDTLDLIAVTRKRLLDHFTQLGKSRISLHELMDMLVNAPDERWNMMWPPLLRIKGIGKKGFWSVTNHLASIDLGNRCNEVWRQKLAHIKREQGIVGNTPYCRLEG